MAGESFNKHGSTEEAWGNSPLEIDDNLRLAFEAVAREIADPEKRRTAVRELFWGADLAEVPSSIVIETYELVRNSSPELTDALDPLETEKAEGQIVQIRPDPDSDPDFDEPSDGLRNVS